MPKFLATIADFRVILAKFLAKMANAQEIGKKIHCVSLIGVTTTFHKKYKYNIVISDTQGQQKFQQMNSMHAFWKYLKHYSIT